MMPFHYLVLAVASFFVKAALSAGPSPSQIKNLVTFGDSYTDVVCITSPPFSAHHSSWHAHQLLSLQDGHADGGIMWPVFAAQDGQFDLFPFAKSGATCSNKLTPRTFPSVFEDQLPAYFAEVANGTLKLQPEETIYTLWIGTNDVGVGTLLTGQQTPGVTLTDTVSCAVDWVSTLYKSGARNFIFQNVSLGLPKPHARMLTYPCGLITDDPARDHHFVFSQLLSQPVLDRSAEHNRMEYFHARAYNVREHDREAHARGARTHAARRTCR